MLSQCRRHHYHHHHLCSKRMPLTQHTAALCLPQVDAGRLQPGSTPVSDGNVSPGCCRKPSTRAMCTTGKDGLHALVNASAAWRRMVVTCTSIRQRPSAGADAYRRKKATQSYLATAARTESACCTGAVSTSCGNGGGGGERPSEVCFLSSNGSHQQIML